MTWFLCRWWSDPGVQCDRKPITQFTSQQNKQYQYYWNNWILLTISSRWKTNLHRSFCIKIKRVERHQQVLTNYKSNAQNIKEETTKWYHHVVSNWIKITFKNIMPLSRAKKQKSRWTLKESQNPPSLHMEDQTSLWMTISLKYKNPKQQTSYTFWK